MEENVKVPFWQKTWVVVLACIFIPPAGIALLWIGKKGGMVLRIILTVILGFYSLAWLSGFVGGTKSATVSDQSATKTEVVAEDTSAADKAAAEKVAADKAASDKAAADKAEADKKAAANTAQYAELFSGAFSAGTDVQPGRYTITAGSGSGNFTISAKNGTLMTNEILGDSTYGVSLIETTILNGDTINISGLDQVIFTPVERTSRTTLPAGYFIAGIDIPTGSYVATTPSGSGNFSIYSSSGSLKTNEILGDSEYAVKQVKVNLNNGDIISISGLNQVVFAP